MKFFPVGTAGHVDHGKTSLIRALTGIDTDRLPEEKRRGLSIDIGFAYFDLPHLGIRVEIIDVPGHERFIKNAITGLAPCRGVLLAVDVVEGIKPQTIEHLEVARAFGIDMCICAITKVDRDRDRIERRREELHDLLVRMGFIYEIVPVSSVTGEGIEELKTSFGNMLQEIDCERLTNRPLRITLDSSFVVKGFGTVLRGSCVEGSLKINEPVIVEPICRKVAVKRMQNHGRFIEEIYAGGRVALNIPDVDRREVERGFWILKEDTYVKSDTLIVEFEKEPKTGKPYHFFFFMREVQGHFKKTGVEGVYILKLREEVVARREDRVVVLNSSGNLEGGLRVLHPYPRVFSRKFLKRFVDLLKENFLLYLAYEYGCKGFEEKLYFKLTGEEPEGEEGVIKIKGRFFSGEVTEYLEKKILEEVDRRVKEKGKVSVKEVADSVGCDGDLVSYLLEKKKKLKGGFVFSEETVRVEILEDRVWSLRELEKEGFSKAQLITAVREGKLHKLDDELYVTDRFFRKLLDTLRCLGSSFDVQEAKRALGFSRKYLIPLLEYMDRLGYTERRGNLRVWKRKM